VDRPLKQRNITLCDSQQRACRDTLSPVDKLPTYDLEMYCLGIDMYLKWRNSWIMRIRKTQISKLTWDGD